MHVVRSMRTVHVVGAVQEQFLRVPYNTSVDEVLLQVTVDPGADMCEIDGSRKITKDEILVVPFIGKMTVYVTGAVKEPGVVVLEQEATPAALAQRIIFSEFADVKAFQRKKVLKNSSVIDIKLKQTQPVKLSGKNRQE